VSGETFHRYKITSKKIASNKTVIKIIRKCGNSFQQYLRKNFETSDVTQYFTNLLYPLAATWVEISFISIGKIGVKFAEEYNNDDNGDEYDTPDAAIIDARDEMFPPGQRVRGITSSAHAVTPARDDEITQLAKHTHTSAGASSGLDLISKLEVDTQPSGVLHWMPPVSKGSLPMISIHRVDQVRNLQPRPLRVQILQRFCVPGVLERI
jgi:hypothetical protein